MNPSRLSHSNGWQAAPKQALWAAGEAGLRVYDDSSSPAGSRWNDFRTSGISIRRIVEFEGALRFDFEFR